MNQGAGIGEHMRTSELMASCLMARIIVPYINIKDARNFLVDDPRDAWS